MRLCPKCGVVLPEDMRFCLQCGAPLLAAAPVKPSTEVDKTSPDEDFCVPRPVYLPDTTLALRSTPSPMIAPREGVPLERRRTHPGRDMVEIDDELLGKSFQKTASRPGTILCRFCKAPLDLEGNFCEQCGAPVRDAMPPGASNGSG